MKKRTFLSFAALFFATMLFSQDYLARARSDKEWGYINREGKYVINPQFEKVESFMAGMAMVQKGGEIGWIDKSGNYVINPQFPNAKDFVKL